MPEPVRSRGDLRPIPSMLVKDVNRLMTTLPVSGRFQQPPAMICRKSPACNRDATMIEAESSSPLGRNDRRTKCRRGR